MIPDAHGRSGRSRAALAMSHAALAVGAIVLFAACSGAGGSTSPLSAAPSPGAAACPTSQPNPLPAGESRTVTIETDKGSIALRIEADLSPIAAGQIVALAGCGYYDGSVFHRVIPMFVIQGGASATSDDGGPGYAIQDEPVTATYGRGTVAMARTAEPNSVTSQFFIVLDDSARDVLASYNTYQIVGSVTSGMDTADAIAAAADAELPSNPVVMTKVTVSNP